MLWQHGVALTHAWWRVQGLL